MNKLSFFNSAALVLPLVSLLIGGGVAFYEVNRLHQLDAEFANTKRQIALVDRALAVRREAPLHTRRATVARSRHEQTDFLTWLRTYATLTHVQITRWSSVSPAASAAAPLPLGVTALDSTLEVTGAYNDIRRFLYSIEGASPRLLNLSNTNWSRVQSGATHLTFNLTRYTALESAPTTPATTISGPPPHVD